MKPLSREEKVELSEKMFRQLRFPLSEEGMNRIGRKFCPEYEAEFPIRQYRGRCHWDIISRGRCRRPFLSKDVCKTGRYW